MGLLQRLFGGGAQGWTPRPFHTNKTAEEYLDWFAHVPPWNKVDRSVLDVYIEQLKGNQMFEVFMHASTTQGLVPKYAALEKVAKLGVPSAVRAQTAALLSNSGVGFLKQAADLLQKLPGREKQMGEVYGAAMDAFESAVNIEPQFTHAYGQLAAARMMLGKRDEAEKWCLKGLAIVAEQLKAPLPNRPDMDLLGPTKEEQRKLQALLASIRA